LFYEHVARLSEEYDRLLAENRSLQTAHLAMGRERCQQDELSSNDVETFAVSPVLVAEALHGTPDDGTPDAAPVLGPLEVSDGMRSSSTVELNVATSPAAVAATSSKDNLKVKFPEQVWQSEQEITEVEIAGPIRFQASNTLQSMDSKAPRVDWDAHLEQGRHALFNQGQKLKAAMAEDMVADMRYDVKNMYKTAGCFQYIARHAWFENFTMIVIIVYALYMSFDTDLNTADIITETHPVFVVGEQIFCFYFSLELFIRFMAFQRKCNCFKDAWFVFDLALVVMMVAETWVMNIIILAMASSSGGPDFLGDASILRIARLLRLTRLLRMARLIRFFPELLIMVKALFSAARSVGFTMVLLWISIYVFAIAFKTMLDGTAVGEDYFPHVPMSMHTLFMHGVFLDSVSDLMGDMLLDSWVGFGLMYVFIILAAVTIMNMLIGVLCEVITAVADAEKEALQVSWTTEVLQTCLSLGADENNDGCIDFGEFQHMVGNAKVRKVLREADVDVQTLVNFVDVLFEGDNESGFDEKVPFSTFMERLLKLRGSNTATVKDLVDLRKWMTKEFLELNKLLLMMKSRRDRQTTRREQQSFVAPTGPYGLPVEFVMQV